MPGLEDNPLTAPFATANDSSPSTIPPADGELAAGLPTIPNFEVLGELGRGGMGIVYRARQLPLNRTVALKMILAGGLARPEDKARFLAEAEAVAALQDPGIVQVYEFGTHDGLSYFALEYCPGGSLAQKLAGTPLPPAEAAALIERLARAMHSAHERGIVHRDLKPGNVLLAADGTPKVTDFGLVKRAEGGEPLTKTGAILGTPSYMAPEQANEAKQVGPPADIYALGAIFYECLTGRPPFKAASSLDTILQVVSTEPVPVRQLNPPVPADLETICHKCLHKNPARRYATAEELARDLGRWGAGEPILARPVRRIEKAVKWARRRPALAALFGVTALATVAMIGGGLYFNAQLLGKQTQLDQRAADLDDVKNTLAREKGRVAGLERTARHNFARSNLILAESNWKSGDGLGTTQALAAVPPDLRQWEWRYQQRRAFGGYMTLWGHTGIVTGVAFSPDGTRFASSGSDQVVRVWDATTGAVMRVLHGHAGRVSSVAFSPDGAWLASGGEDCTVRLWDARTGALIRTLTGHTDRVESVAFSPDGARLASGGWDDTVRLWNARTGELQRTVTGQFVAAVAFSSDGRRLATGGNDDLVRLIDVTTGESVKTLDGHGGVTSVAFSPDGELLATVGERGVVRIWAANSGALERTLTDTAFPINAVAFSPDGCRIACGGWDDKIRVWDAKTGVLRETLAGHTGWVMGVAFSPDGGRLISGGADQTARVWNVKSGATPAMTLSGHTDRVQAVAFSPDGGRLASAGGEGAVRLWDAKNGKPLATLTAQDEPVMAVAFSPDGKRLATGDGDNEVRIWDTTTGAEVKSLTGHTLWVTSVAFSLDGRRLASGSADNKVNIWDADTGTTAFELSGHTEIVWGVAYSPDGRRLASCSEDHTVRIWDAKTGTATRTLTGHTGPVRGVAFSPDGNRLASGGEDTVVRLWDANSGALVRTFAGHTDQVLTIAFTPDGKRLATGGSDHVVRLWDPQTGAAVLTLAEFDGPVTCLAFSPSGDRLATGTEDRSLRVWNSKPGAEVRALVGHTASVWGVAFSPDGTRLASGGLDQTVRLWDLSTGNVLRTFQYESGPAGNVAFSPDGAKLGAQTKGGESWIWDLTSGEGTATEIEPDWQKWDAEGSSSPDRQWRACPGSDGTILLVKPLPPDGFEIGYREAMARPDPDWHWQQAQQCEKDDSWFAARFHCEQVLKSRPNDAAAKKLLAAAREHLRGR